MSKIIIPSKNIYKKSINSLPNNVLNKVEMEYLLATEKEDLKVSIQTVDVKEGFEEESQSKSILQSGLINSDGKLFGAFSGIYVAAQYRVTLPDLTIPRAKNQSYITRAYNPTKTADISVEGVLIKEKWHSADVTILSNGSYALSVNIESENIDRTEEETAYTMDKISVVSEAYDSSSGNTYSSEAIYNISSPTVSYWDKEDDDIVINGFSCIAGIEYFEIKGNTFEDYKSGLPIGTNSTFPCTRYIYSPTKVIVDFKGDILTLDLEQKVINSSINDGKKSKSFSINSNELIQDKDSCQTLIDSILDTYKKGKQTATIKCGINDYYGTLEAIEEYHGTSFPQTLSSLDDFDYDDDSHAYIYTPTDNIILVSCNATLTGYSSEDTLNEFDAYVKNNRIYFKSKYDYSSDDVTAIYLTYEYIDLNNNGQKIIDTNSKSEKPICFNIHDIVIPMALNSEGVDLPWSTNSEGVPRCYEIIGIKKFYDGAVWQELNLQEVIINYQEQAKDEEDDNEDEPSLKLPTPSISASGNVLIIEDSSNRAETFALFSDDEEIAQVVAKSGVSEVVRGDTLSCSVDCGIGDTIVVAIATIDTFTLNSGWTLISTSNTNSTDTTNQRLSWAYKVAQKTTETITVTQSSEGRIYINMVALTKSVELIDNGYIYVNEAGSSEITLSKPSGLVLWAIATPIWNTSQNPYPIWSVSNNIPIVQLGKNTASRLVLGYDDTNETNVTFYHSSPSTKIVGRLSVRR